MVFGIIPECRSASLRKKRSASPESSVGHRFGALKGDLKPDMPEIDALVSLSHMVSDATIEARGRHGRQGRDE
jgi:hypothetical protein